MTKVIGQRSGRPYPGDMEHEQTLRELVVEIPGAARIFERLGLDYCCGGNQTLEQACQSGRLTTSEVMDSLQAAKEVRLPQDFDWQAESLSTLAALTACALPDKFKPWTTGLKSSLPCAN